MSHRLSMLCIALLLATMSIAASPTKRVDANTLRIINRGFTNTERTYARLPQWIADSIRPSLWNRAQCSAGMAVRFATNSTTVGVRYRLHFNAHLPHMADTGVKGVDLYVMHPDSTWQYVNTCRPNPDSLKYCSRKLVERLEPTMKEFMIYLPLYDGVEQVSVEVDSAAIITPGNIDLPSDKGRIVTYGTSIMQGGCASRTGMAAPAIIQRETGRQVVNMGFSGEGKMDLVMARALAEIPNVSLYVIDPVPNCTDQMCDSLTVPFISRLRQLAPGIPIIMVEGPIYPYARYDSYYGEYLPRKNAIFRRGYEALRAAGITDLYYLEATEINGPDYQGTVDGIHLTDLGFRNYADRILPLIRSILGKE